MWKEIARKLHLTPANTRKICSLALASLRKNIAFSFTNPRAERINR